MPFLITIREIRADLSTQINYKFKDSIYYFHKEDFTRWPAGTAYILFNEYPSQPGIYVGVGGESLITVTADFQGEQDVKVRTNGNDLPYSHPNIYLTANTETLNLGYTRINRKVIDIKDVKVMRHTTPFFPTDLTDFRPQFEYINMLKRNKAETRFSKIDETLHQMTYNTSTSQKKG